MVLVEKWLGKHIEVKQQLIFAFDETLSADTSSTEPVEKAAAPVADEQRKCGTSRDKPAIGDTHTDKSRPFDYRVIRSKRRTLGITVHRGQVEVRAPNRIPKQWIEDFVQEKYLWIIDRVTEQLKQEKEIYRITNGTVLDVLGAQLKIEISTHSRIRKKTTKRGHIEQLDDILFIQVPESQTDLVSHTTENHRYVAPVNKTSDLLQQRTSVSLQVNTTATKLFFNWLKLQAERYMSAATRELALHMALGDKLTKVKYRRTSSKWGHCTSEGDIQYNPLIALAPLFVIDYIIAHEVCHLQHANHSKVYWKLVDKVCSQRVAAEQWLKRNGHTLAIEIPKY